MRLEQGLHLDRARPLRFRFDSREFTGFAGDTLASALLANDTRLFARSFKYHRPRGVLTCDSSEPNALCELRTGAYREPNTRCTTVELYDGLEAYSQNRWPSLNHDFMAINRLFAPFFFAGFYYKTFMWPAKFWEKLYEPLIRRAAGLGRAATQADPDRYDKAWAHCDVLVIGSGPAGLAAAYAAAQEGKRVLVCEERSYFGGQLLYEDQTIDGESGANWAARIVKELKGMERVRLMRRTAVFGVYDGQCYGAVESRSDHESAPQVGVPRKTFWRIQAKATVLAGGAHERLMAFPGNDVPGVMLSSALRAYLRGYGAAPARRYVVFTNNDDGYRTAQAIVESGLELVAVVDARKQGFSQAEQTLGVNADRAIQGVITAVHGGRRGIKRVEIRLSDGSLRCEKADGVAVSGGWNPAIQIASQMGHRPCWNEAIQAFTCEQTPLGLYLAGAAAGHLTLSACLKSGHDRAQAICGALRSVPFQAPSERYAIEPVWEVDTQDNGKAKAFIDLQHDVTTTDVRIAYQEGYRSVEHLKRYTTLGMATDQGKNANVNGLAMMAQLTGQSIDQTGTTRYRPPYIPVTLGALAGPHVGKNFKATRYTPSHRFASERGAVFVETGQWLRAQWYPQQGESHWRESVNREVSTVRGAVGVCDVSTLGKIDLAGQDVGAFLNLVYCNGFGKLPVGKARYGLMLREDGFVMDDGTTSRLRESLYCMTTTTANAATIMQHLEFCHQVLVPHLDVHMTSTSEQWAQFSVAGPRARDTLSKLVIDCELSNEAFPFMAAREVHLVGGMQARLYRISFSGELAFEVAVPTPYGDSLIRNIMRAGEQYGIAPYGTEALGVMRIEKGHAAGPELSGTTTAYDLGMARMMSKKKDFIGRAMAEREALNDPARQTLVGVKPVDASQRLHAGAHLLDPSEPMDLEHDLGYVTSACHSPTLNTDLGLALLSNAAQYQGKALRASDPLRDHHIDVQITDPVFYDPSGERQMG